MFKKISFFFFLFVVLFLAVSSRADTQVFLSNPNNEYKLFWVGSYTNVDVNSYDGTRVQLYTTNYTVGVDVPASFPSNCSFVGWGGEVLAFTGNLWAYVDFGNISNINIHPNNPQTFTLTVNGGITSGTFAPGAKCSISPTIPQGQTFTGDSAEKRFY